MEYCFFCHKIFLALIILIILIIINNHSYYKFKRVNYDKLLFNDSLFTLVLLCTISESKLVNIKLMDDVVIVGGGIIGAATAYFLSKEGRKVKVIERDPT